MKTTFFSEQNKAVPWTRRATFGHYNATLMYMNIYMAVILKIFFSPFYLQRTLSRFSSQHRTPTSVSKLWPWTNTYWVWFPLKRFKSLQEVRHIGNNCAAVEDCGMLYQGFKRPQQQQSGSYWFHKSRLTLSYHLLEMLPSIQLDLKKTKQKNNNLLKSLDKVGTKPIWQWRENLFLKYTQQIRSIIFL